MPQSAELIEVATALLAAVAVLVSLLMLARSWRTWRDAGVTGRCRAVRTLAWMRVRNEAFRLVIAGGTTYAGVVQVLAPAPAAPGPNRPIFQAVWLLIAFICLAKSTLNERDTRRVIATIERERAAGWPR